MRGFDRPLKPEWIKGCIDTINIGEKIANHKQEMIKAVYGVDGDVGNRKIRTLISRYFFTGENTKEKSVIESHAFKVIKEYIISYSKPLMLLTILCKEPLLKEYTNIIKRLYGNSDGFSNKLLKENAINMMGDRDISGRSLRNFLNTLIDFGVIKEEKKGMYSWNKKFILSDKQALDFIKIYSESYLKDKNINLLSIPEEFFFFFETPNLLEIANTFNGIEWSYTRRVNTATVTLY